MYFIKNARPVELFQLFMGLHVHVSASMFYLYHCVCCILEPWVFIFVHVYVV